MSITKAIRFSDEEYQQIECFINQNPFFDFSSLTRTAIKSFVESPSVEIRPVKPQKISVKRNESHNE